jgi:hypothetical protein
VVRSRALLSDPRFLSLWLSRDRPNCSECAAFHAACGRPPDYRIVDTQASWCCRSSCPPSLSASLSVCFWTGWIRACARGDEPGASGACPVLLLPRQRVDHLPDQHGVATAGLFFNPAVVSVIPSIVPRDRWYPPSSLYNFTLTASQLRYRVCRADDAQIRRGRYVC